jgi:hypothetical protein
MTILHPEWLYKSCCKGKRESRVAPSADAALDLAGRTASAAGVCTVVMGCSREICHLW